jgi:hypothetical protein
MSKKMAKHRCKVSLNGNNSSRRLLDSERIGALQWEGYEKS